MEIKSNLISIMFDEMIDQIFIFCQVYTRSLFFLLPLFFLNKIQLIHATIGKIKRTKKMS